MHTLAEAKVGGRLGSMATMGMKSVKIKAYLQGAHAAVTTKSLPPILIELPKGDTIENYVLVVMDGKSDRREIEVGSAGGVVGAKTGIRAEAIQKTTSKPLGGNKFNLVTETLKKGDYIIYVEGSADSIKHVAGRGYDFTVE
ncbi:MAG TPA: hypothetical protein VJ999_07320 [Candidatus Sulfotelmatobacter sp.]|nr:hypothetical protein [Candidatus Sulfotelmatobacter sp.]